MRRYLLDTTPLTAYLYNRQPAISLISPWIINDEVATSILVYGEIIEHIKGSAQFATQRQQLKDRTYSPARPAAGGRVRLTAG
jgi:predicted nucleic acid-binding protein